MSTLTEASTCVAVVWVLLTLHAYAEITTTSWVYRTPYSQPTWSGRPSSDIKGDLQYVHMPAFVDLPNGSLALAWQGSVLPYEGSHLQALYWSTSSDNGRSWTMPSVLRPPRNQLPLWGPVWHTNGTSLVLFYSASNNQCRWGGETGRGAWSPGGDILMSVSLDNGATWSKDRTILSFAEGGRPIPKVLANQMVVTERGRWVLPFWYEQGGGCRDAPELHGVPGVLVSDDEGGSWSVVRIPLGAAATKANTWLIEPALVEVCLPVGCSEGTMLRMYFRTAAGWMYEAVSTDDGCSWSEPTPMTVPNNNSKVNAIVLPGGEVLLAFNNVTVSRLRTPLSLALSVDDGQSWLEAGTVERAPAGSFAYPALHVVPGNASECGTGVLVAYQVQFPPGVDPEALAVAADTVPSVRNLRESESVHRGERALQEMQLRAWGLTCWGLRVALIC